MIWIDKSGPQFHRFERDLKRYNYINNLNVGHSCLFSNKTEVKLFHPGPECEQYLVFK